MRSPLDTLVRQELNALADSAPAPTDLAERAIRRHLRRRRFRWGAVASAIAVAATAAAAVLVPAGSSGPSVHLNVVYAFVRMEGGWQVLDPMTGQYRTANVGAVSPPTADLRYAAVIPPTKGDRTLDRDRKIGRYESATGEIRWYDVPVVPVASVAISPDGRHAVVLGDRQQLVVVDLAEGTTTSADMRDAFQGSGFNQPVWRPDSRHFMVRDHVFDQEGRIVGVQPVPAGAEVVAARPDDPGLLVRDVIDKDDLRRGYWLGVTDERGRIVRRSGELRPGCPGCSSPTSGIWSARPGEILLIGQNSQTFDNWIYASDLDGSEEKPASMQLVHHVGPGVSADLVIAPLTDLSDAPGADTF